MAVARRPHAKRPRGGPKGRFLYCRAGSATATGGSCGTAPGGVLAAQTPSTHAPCGVRDTLRSGSRRRLSFELAFLLPVSLQDFKAGPAGGRLRRPSSAGETTMRATGASTPQEYQPRVGHLTRNSDVRTERLDQP